MTIPERFICRARRLDCRCVPYEWAWAEANRNWIAAKWGRLRAEKPRLFNGRILLVSDHALDGSTFRARFFEADYAAFLGWRDAGFPPTPVVNGFAMGALQGSDGAFVMGVMGAHTANAGRIYFPAGTPDPSDVRPDGVVDLASSIVRELGEETGLVPTPDAIGSEWIIVREGPKLSFLRPIRLAEPAEAIIGRILAHLRGDPDPELAGACAVRDVHDIDEAAMPEFLKVFLRWWFRESAGQG